MKSRANAFMVQGLGTNVGKSLLVAGLCRLARQRGLKVAPFKPQNMSNNAAVTVEGGEIGRAQALQARACGLAPRNDMNPVLLKPESDTGSQVIVLGQRYGQARGAAYRALKPKLLPEVLGAFHRLAAEHDLVIVEGAGSAAEVNLQASDFANMGFAEAAGVPVILVGDIDRGGVIASLVGTQKVLAPAHSARIEGFLVNKFRGDPALFSDALHLIEAETGWPSLGLIPYFEGAADLPAEDSVDLTTRAFEAAERPEIRIGVLQLPRIANFDDLDPLRLEPGVETVMLAPHEVLPAGLDLVLIPGSKATRADLEMLLAHGWDIDIKAHVRRGGLVLGLCGGYQMLGEAVHDPEGIEGAPGSTQGLGLLRVETTLRPAKALRHASGEAEGFSGGAIPLSGYEMHVGETEGEDRQRPFLTERGEPEGAVSGDGRAAGTYWHGVFAGEPFRRAYLAKIRRRENQLQNYQALVEKRLDELAALIESHADPRLLERIIKSAP